jgi:hypothetical protein
MDVGQKLSSQQNEGAAIFHFENASKQFEQYKARNKNDAKAIQLITEEFELAFKLRKEVIQWTDQARPLSAWHQQYAVILSQANIGHYKRAVENYSNALTELSMEPASDRPMSAEKEMKAGLIAAANKFKTDQIGKNLSRRDRLQILKEIVQNNILIHLTNIETSPLAFLFNDEHAHSAFEQLGIKGGLLEEIYTHAMNILWYESPKLKQYKSQKNAAEVPGGAMADNELSNLSLAVQLIGWCKLGGLKANNDVEKANALVTAESLRRNDLAQYHNHVLLSTPSPTPGFLSSVSSSAYSMLLGGKSLLSKMSSKKSSGLQVFDYHPGSPVFGNFGDEGHFINDNPILGSSSLSSNSSSTSSNIHIPGDILSSQNSATAQLQQQQRMKQDSIENQYQI